VEGSPEPQEAPRTNLRSSSGRARWIVPLVLVLAAGGYGLYRWLAPSEPAPSLEQPAAAQPEPAAAPSTAVAAAEPPATAEEAPALLERASQHPLFRKGLALPGLVRRWVVVTENLSQGDSPRDELRFLAPRGRFSVVPRGDGFAASADAWARYDEFAAAVESLDARAAASAYRRLHGVLDAAFAALGYKPGALDAATARALRRIADAPVATEETKLVQAEGLYVYADQKLEQLPEVEKHLLRMGPVNERKIQAKAKELLAALDLPVVAAKR
jgi:hypothetical protein